ncbi:zinc finger and BTB domain-containing protein 22 [Protopterus annectens]|uniref:zinc finger and BTB domain-containing protein 22 n=1 Tax=Protopterus annectens TaxID=7888 RepID=UPI001CFB4EE6|nr:zinc finger and BTB domain-containing protein 22 [Protopterus annectens]
MDPGCAVVHLDFPEVTNSLLENLNQQRIDDKLCDITIIVQGHVFKAHRAVLAASSPYFHDQVLLKNMTSVVLPSVMDPVAFEHVLGSAYTGKLSMQSEDIVNYLTVGSVLQMWHIVDKCTELLKENKSTARTHSSRTSENQSPSSSNYFSPRDTTEPAVSEQGKYNRVDRDGLDASDDFVTFQPPGAADKPVRGSDSVTNSEKLVVETDEDISDSASGSSKWPVYVQPSIMPQKKWVFIKKERSQEDLVLTCEEDEDPVEHTPLTRSKDGSEQPLSISNVRTLSAGSVQDKSDIHETQKLEEQVNFCESSDDFSYEQIDEVPSQFSQRTLLPMDMQGNQIMVYPPRSSSEHGAVSLTANSVDSTKIFLCHCGKTFTHKSMRDRHVNMHLNLRPFDCPVCNKKFKMKHHLTEHMKTHTGLKPYECEVCGKKFMWRDSFMRHKGHCERRHRTASKQDDIVALEDYHAQQYRSSFIQDEVEVMEDFPGQQSGITVEGTNTAPA